MSTDGDDRCCDYRRPGACHDWIGYRLRSHAAYRGAHGSACRHRRRPSGDYDAAAAVLAKCFMACKLLSMKPLDDLARADIDPALLAQVRSLVERQQADLAQCDANLARRDALLAEKEFKITALTHELACYRRIRFVKASETLVGEQRLLFKETVDMDLATIEEELEGQMPAKRQRSRAGRQP